MRRGEEGRAVRSVFRYASADLGIVYLQHGAMERYA